MVRGKVVMMAWEVMMIMVGKGVGGGLWWEWEVLVVRMVEILAVSVVIMEVAVIIWEMMVVIVGDGGDNG